MRRLGWSCSHVYPPSHIQCRCGPRMDSRLADAKRRHAMNCPDSGGNPAETIDGIQMNVREGEELPRYDLALLQPMQNYATSQIHARLVNSLAPKYVYIQG